MSRLLVGLALVLAGFPMLAAGDAMGSCEHEFEAAFQNGGRLKLQIRSGDIDIVGGGQEKVRVTCRLKSSDRPGDVKIRFQRNGDRGELNVSGGPNNDVHVRVEVPQNSGLVVRSPAGDLSVEGVVGDKDVSLHAGDLTISVGNPGEYRHAEASVTAGDLVASAFGVSKDGLFRSFSHDNRDGKYTLKARVMAGDLTLK